METDKIIDFVDIDLFKQKARRKETDMATGKVEYFDISTKQVPGIQHMDYLPSKYITLDRKDYRID